MKCLFCNSENITQVEYNYSNPKHYDGISEIECSDCKRRSGRWCEEELFEGEQESPYCEGDSHK